jgi:hypothetical protein
VKERFGKPFAVPSLSRRAVQGNAGADRLRKGGERLGYLFVLGHCIGCGRLFTFHPQKVPSVVVYGVREPICQECVNRFNPLRKAKGLEEIVPLPGAYEPMNEEESEDVFKDDF